MAVKKNVCSLVLLALIALKVSAAALHIYLHHGHEDEHMEVCELCEHAMYNQNIEFSTPVEFHNLEVDYSPTFCQLENSYDIIFIKLPVDNTRFGRPPPSLV